MVLVLSYLQRGYTRNILERPKMQVNDILYRIKYIILHANKY